LLGKQLEKFLKIVEKMLETHTLGYTFWWDPFKSFGTLNFQNEHTSGNFFQFQKPI
jgi:hypothetical protein